MYGRCMVVPYDEWCEQRAIDPCLVDGTQVHEDITLAYICPQKVLPQAIPKLQRIAHRTWQSSP